MRFISGGKSSTCVLPLALVVGEDVVDEILQFDRFGAAVDIARHGIRSVRGILQRVALGGGRANTGGARRSWTRDGWWCRMVRGTCTGLDGAASGRYLEGWQRRPIDFDVIVERWPRVVVRRTVICFFGRRG